jgi:hypothetical protein
MILILISLLVHAQIHNIESEKSIFITDLHVTDSAAADIYGPLGFISQFYTVNPASNRTFFPFFNSWLSLWQVNSGLNGLPARILPSYSVYQLWPHDVRGRPIEQQAPFRLLGLSYRPDLIGADRPHGEFRFIYAAYNSFTHAPVEFYVIFEYKIPEMNQEKPWHDRFAELSRWNTAEPEYLEKVIEIASDIAKAGNLSAVRTNELFFSTTWELRNYELGEAGYLQLKLTPQTAHDLYKNDRADELQDWILANSSDILRENFKLPESFLASGSSVDNEFFTWNLPRVRSTDVRKKFGMQSCNGCHTGETETRFTHIASRQRGELPLLSEYLKKQIPIRKSILETLIRGEQPQLIEKSFPH